MSLLAGRGEQHKLSLPDFSTLQPVFRLIHHLPPYYFGSGADRQAPEHHHPKKTGSGCRIFATPD